VFPASESQRHVRPDAVISRVNTVVAVGPAAADVVRQVAERVEVKLLITAAGPVESGQALAWFAWKDGAAALSRFRVQPPRGERERHRRKYAEGTLGPDKSFYFRGPEDKLQLRARISAGSCRWLMVSTTTPGFITSDAATTPPGSATPSKTTSWPTRSRQSKARNHCRQRAAARRWPRPSDAAIRTVDRREDAHLCDAA
jgi:hypothetical protein